MRGLLTTLVFLLPPKFPKARLLRWLGHDVHPKTHIGMSLVRNVDRFELDEGAVIGSLNLIKSLALVKLGRGAQIHSMNWITGDSGFWPDAEDNGTMRSLILEKHSLIRSHQFLDCGGGIVLEEDARVIGGRTTMLSHSADLVNGGVAFSAIRLGPRAIIATNCTLLPGTEVGEGAVLAAGSATWQNQQLAEHCIHGGVPARRLKPQVVPPELYQIFRYAD